MSPKDAALRSRFGDDHAVTGFLFGDGSTEAICSHCGESFPLSDELLDYSETVGRCLHCRAVVVFDEAALIGHANLQSRPMNNKKPGWSDAELQ